MGNPIGEDNSFQKYIEKRLELFLIMVDSLNPEEIQLEDVDALIRLLEDMEKRNEGIRVRMSEVTSQVE